MTNRSFRVSGLVLVLFGALAIAGGPADAEQKTNGTGGVKCSCLCGASSAGGEEFKVSAPNGDPTQCEKLNNLACSTTAGGKPLGNDKTNSCTAGSVSPDKNVGSHSTTILNAPPAANVQ